MSIQTKREAEDLPLGATVTVTGYVVGRSEFQDGRPTYLLEYEQKGKPVREWFHSDDFDVEDTA